MSPRPVGPRGVATRARLVELHARLGEDHPACADVDPELFWPVSEQDTATIARAKQVCAGCPVLAACRQWGIEHEDEGIWGGLTPTERGPYRWRYREAARRRSPWYRGWQHTA